MVFSNKNYAIKKGTVFLQLYNNYNYNYNLSHINAQLIQLYNTVFNNTNAQVSQQNIITTKNCTISSADAVSKRTNDYKNALNSANTNNTKSTSNFNHYNYYYQKSIDNNYNYSYSPSTKIYYPEPFIASPTFVHNDI